MVRKTRLLAVVLSLVLVATLVVTGCAQQKPEEKKPAEQPKKEETIRIAHMAPLTGSAASYGYYMINAAKMAVEEINAAGGINGKKIEYFEIDETSNSAQAVEACKKAISLNPVAMLGPNRSGGVLAAEYLWKEAKIPTITDGTSAETTKKGNPYTFRMQVASEYWMPILAKTAVERFKVKKPAIIYGLNDYSKANYLAIVPAFEKYGLKPVTVQTFNDGDQDFTAQLLAAKKAGADSLFIFSYTPEIGKMLKQRAELGMSKIPVFAERAASVPDVEKLAGSENYEGLVTSTTWCTGDPDPKKQEFLKKYESKYGHTISATHVNHYDSIYILADIIKRVGTDREKIREELSKLDYQGVLGHYVCDKEGNLMHWMHTQVRQGGKWVLLDTEEYPVQR
ncbi:MAG TPA: ABC transporter substrate-binding protein [Firmicutes bacterium]|nr:ABC transporter substrate-binding protein [Bacillota bacterium]